MVKTPHICGMSWCQGDNANSLASMRVNVTYAKSSGSPFSIYLRVQSFVYGLVSELHLDLESKLLELYK